MASYRDDREALRQRVTELEQELTRIRDADKQDELKKELDALTAQVARTTVKLDEERAGLSEVAARIDAARVRAGLGPPAQAEHSPAVRRVGIAVVAGVLAVVLIGVWMGQRSSPEPPLPAIPGAPHDVEPLALLEHARRLAGSKEQLAGIEARYVRASGHVDLQGPGYAGSIKYMFAAPPLPEPPPDPSRPLGAPGPSVPAPMHSVVIVDRAGIHVHRTMVGPAHTVPEPRCSIADVWRAAVAAGAPDDAVAIISYQHASAYTMTSGGKLDRREGPLWRFRIEGTPHEHDIDAATCRVAPR